MKNLRAALGMALPLLLIVIAANLGHEPAVKAMGKQPPYVGPIPYGQQQTKTIENHSFGYRLIYPADWEARLPIENRGNRPLEVMRQRITLFGPTGAEINVDVWHNPQHLAIAEWFDAVLGWVRNSTDIQIEWTGHSVAGESAITFHQPRPDGGIPAWSTVFLHGGLAFRIEYVAIDGGNSISIYQSVLREFRFIPISESESWAPDIPTGHMQRMSIMPLGCNCTPGPCGYCCGISDPDNPFPCCNGNCTWYARYRWDHTGPQPRPHSISACNGNAWEWYPQAVNAGYTVGTTPACDSIVIFQPNMCQHGWCTGGLGHVAYVTEVSGNIFEHGSIGWDNDCIYGTAPGSKDTMPNPTSGHPNVAFIYHINPCCCSQSCLSRSITQASEGQICMPSYSAGSGTEGEIETGELTASMPILNFEYAPTPKFTSTTIAARVADLTFVPAVFPSLTKFVPLPTSAPTVTPLPTVDPLLPRQQTMAQLDTVPPASAHYILARSVFGSGGGPKISAHYVVQDTSGQTTGVAWRQSSSYVLRSGYWGRVGAATEPAPYIIYLPIVIKQQP